MTCTLAMFGCAFLVALSAGAEPKKTVREELPPTARTSWDNAHELFDAQNWAAAKAEYEHAYDVSKNPRVLFNVAVCEKNLGHYLKASAAFRKEIAEAPGKVPPAEQQKVKDVLATLESLISTMVVTSNEPDATLAIDKEEQSQKTPFPQPITIDVGVHTLKLSKVGFADIVLENFSVVSGEVAQARFKLEPIERRGHVHVDVSGVPRAALFFDGKDVGNAPYDGELIEGTHIVEARGGDEYVSARQPFVVKYRENTSLVITLATKRHEGLLRVSAAPTGAIIEVDGRRVGTDTWEGPVTSMSGHTVLVKRDGFYTFSQEVILQDDQERNLPVTLNAEKTWIWWLLGSAVVGIGVASVIVMTQIHNDPIPGTLAAAGGWGTTGFHLIHF